MLNEGATVEGSGELWIMDHDDHDGGEASVLADSTNTLQSEYREDEGAKFPDGSNGYGVCVPERRRSLCGASWMSGAMMKRMAV